MLHGEGQVLLREIEHIEDDGLRAAILSVVDGVHHFYDGLALMYGLLLAVLSDDFILFLKNLGINQSNGISVSCRQETRT